MFDGTTFDAQKLPARKIEIVRAASRAGTLMCPVCDQALVAKLGEQVSWHFAHRADCTYKYHEPESDPHKKAKTRLATWADTQWPGSEIREEWRLPTISQIADVLVHRVGRRPLALEIQYADLAASSWRKRSEGYRSVGLDQLWVLGHTRLKTRRRDRRDEIFLDMLASTLLAARHPLIYLNGRSGYASLVAVAPAAVHAAQSGRVGWWPCALQKKPLEGLRLDGARPYFPAE